jgi:SAM-dependent methyltransferase
MNDVFGGEYAGIYNLLYGDKDYSGECDLIGRLFHQYGNSISSVLDLGCGTGNHAFPIARRGYEVVGVERSESMLAVAQQRLAGELGKGRIGFRKGDIRNIRLERSFDSALMMFAVLGYQIENADVLSALQTARAHLQPGGLLIFDIWYGPAVLRERPSDRIKITRTDEGRVLRVASGELQVARQVCTVRFHIWRLAGERLLAETQETHVMRFFFPLELDLLLASCAFTPIRVGAFPQFDRDPDETTWNILVVARAV